MLYRSPVSALQGAIDQDESESLQADVMRFMAILGLCLMVIFALVQSLPSVGESREDAREREAESAAQNVEIAELRYQLNVLGAQNREAKAQMQQYELTVEQLYDQVQGAQEVNARIEELTAQVDELLNEQTVSQQRLSDQQELLQAQESELAALHAQIDNVELTQELPGSEDAVPTPADAVEQENAGDNAQVAEEPVETSQQTNETEGFRLTFASNEDFFQLVESAEIEVFVITPQNEGFQLGGNSQQLFPTSLPTAVQDINKASLPPSLLTLMSRQRISTESRWGVVLSERVLQSIDQARGDARGGTLSIAGSGEVQLRQ